MVGTGMWDTQKKQGVMDHQAAALLCGMVTEEKCQSPTES